LELGSRTRESITGRTWSFHLHPLSYFECLAVRNAFEKDRRFERDLVYEFYPEAQAYPGASWQKVDRENDLSFISR
jgi:hypothetical protein